MKSKHFKLLSILTIVSLMSLTPFSAAKAEEVHFVFHKIDFAYQTVQLRTADGPSSTADFLSEIVLLPDGRANGGFGLWERGRANGLSLYRVIEGRELDRVGPFFEFKAKRLVPASEDEIIINLRPAPGHAPTGSVTFFVDGISTAAGQPLSFAATARVRTHTPIASVTDLVIDRFNYINASPQTIVVETRRGNFSAIFESVALVFPDGEAIGFARLSTSDSGAPIEIHFAGGRLHFNEEEFRWGLMHGETQQRGQARPLPVLMVIADMQSASEPCRIYDIAGTQVGTLHFEADTDITRFTFGER